MKRREIEVAVEREVEQWPGVTVKFKEGGKHPKARLEFEGVGLDVTYSNTPGDSKNIVITLADVRRTLKKLGATRAKPEPTREEDEAPYRKPNNGAEQRPSPVKGERAAPRPSLSEKLATAGVVGPTDVRPFVPEGQDEDEDERQARIDALMAQIDAIRDGVYFGLPEEVYHAVPRISASGLQKLCVSAGTFWRDSWLNPEQPLLDEEATNAQVLGKAYHCARLEPERFHASFCRAPAREDFAGSALITADTGVKAMLKELGEPQTSGNESTVERAGRLRDAGHEGPIWCLIMAEFEAERAGRVPIPAKFYDQMITDMERIRGSGEIAELLTGGQAEVSVFWTDEHGLPCKCRFDYLTPGWWDDFKTFDNSRGKVLDQALADAMRYNRYYVGAGHYRDGIEAVRTGGLQIQGEATDEQRALIAAIQIRPAELACWYVFQEKNGVPNLLAKEFPFYEVPISTRLHDIGATEDQIATAHEATIRPTGLFARATIDILHAKDQFVLYSNAYDPGTPWFPLHARGRFSDLDFSPHWIEGKI